LTTQITGAIYKCTNLSVDSRRKNGYAFPE
jgi:hypothetical protein